MVGGKRLGICHVEGGTGDLTFGEGSDQRGRVDHGPPGHVDQVGSWLHQRQLLVRDQMPGRVVEGGAQHDVVRPLQELAT